MTKAARIAKVVHVVRFRMFCDAYEFAALPRTPPGGNFASALNVIPYGFVMIAVPIFKMDQRVRSNECT